MKTDPGVPKIVIGFLSSPSGLGQSARLAASAFRQRGFSVLGIDVSDFFTQHSGYPKYDLPDGRKHRGAAHVVAVINAPEMKYCLWLLGRNFLRDKFVTGYWSWELQNVPEAWIPGFADVHEVLAPSRFSAEAIGRRSVMGSIGVAPHPVTLDCPPLRASNPVETRRPFTIISAVSAASALARKNPIGLIRAFRLAFGNSNEAQLNLLVTGTSAYPAGRSLVLGAIGDAANINVVWAPFTRTAFYRWWSEADAFASLHRSEGFSLPIAEAMCAGYPVIATGWSGNMDYMTAETSFPVRYRLVDVDDPQNLYNRTEGVWAEPDEGHAAEVLLRLKEDRALAGAVGVAARKSAMEKFNPCCFVQPIIYS